MQLTMGRWNDSARVWPCKGYGRSFLPKSYGVVELFLLAPSQHPYLTTLFYHMALGKVSLSCGSFSFLWRRLPEAQVLLLKGDFLRLRAVSPYDSGPGRLEVYCGSGQVFSLEVFAGVVWLIDLFSLLLATGGFLVKGRSLYSRGVFTFCVFVFFFSFWSQGTDGR